MTFLPPAFHFNSITGTTSTTPPPSTHLIITDTPDSPADFLIYHLIASSLREKRRVKVVDFKTRGRLHYEVVARKMGTRLPAPSSSSFKSITTTTQGEFDYYAPSLDDLSPDQDDEDEDDQGRQGVRVDGVRKTLRRLFDRITGGGGGDGPSITTTMAKTDSSILDHQPAHQDRPGPVFFLVGLSHLVWMGWEVDEVSRLMRALVGFVKRTRSTLITHLHTPLLLSPQSTADYLASMGVIGGGEEADGEVGLLLRLLRAGSAGGRSKAGKEAGDGDGGETIWWRVEELKSGRSGVVHGEISIHPLSPAASKIQGRVRYQNPLQYRVDDTVVRVFPKGTGRGYL